MATASLPRHVDTLDLPALHVDPSVWEPGEGEGSTDALEACIRLGDLTLRLEAWAVDTVAGIQRARTRVDGLVQRLRRQEDPPYQTTTIVGRPYIVLAFGS
jgi:hypothetical protein